MPITATNPVISELQDRIRRLEGGAARRGEVLSFRIAYIDARLPAGGLTCGAVHEVAVVGPMKASTCSSSSRIHAD